MVDKKVLGIGAIITLVLAMTGGYYLNGEDQAYHCDSKDMVMVCEKLSGGAGTRCYFDDTYKICKEGWIEIELGEEVVQEERIIEVYPLVEGTRWECSPKECVRLE